MVKRLLVSLLLSCCLVYSAWAKPTPSPVSYYHNWVDDEGVSHITPCLFSNWTYVNVLNNTDPDFIDTSESSLAATYVMLQSPVGWTGGWHRNPYPQLVIFIQGVSGMLFRELAYVIAFSLLCSLVVSLSIVPMLASRLMVFGDAREARGGGALEAFASRGFAELNNGYRDLIRWALRRRIATVAANSPQRTPD